MFIRKSTTKAHLTTRHPGSNKSHFNQCETDKALKFIEIQTDVNYPNIVTKNLSKISNKSYILESKVSQFFKSIKPKDDNLAIKVKASSNLGDKPGNLIQKHQFNSEQQISPGNDFKTKPSEKNSKHKETSHQNPSAKHFPAPK